MSKRKPIQGFVASILNFILVLVVLNVIYIYTKTLNEEGREVNVTQVAVKQVHQLYDDVINGWNTVEKDTIK